MKGYKIQEVADKCGVSYWTVKRWIYKGILKAKRDKRPDGLDSKNSPWTISGKELARIMRGK